MRCKDCIHFVACVDFWYSDYDCFDNIEQSKQKHANDEGCVHFKPTADVVEVRHGKWIDKPTGAYCRMQSWCSACGKHSGIGGIESNRHKPYCPNCGADMRGINNAKE